MHAVANDETLRPLDYWIGYRFGLIATRVGVLAARQYRAKHRLTTPLWRVLAVVARFEPLSASTLSEHSRLDPPKVSRAIERLVERKLLLRRTDKADERRAVLTLTARGRAIHDDIAAYVTALEDRISSTLNASEERTMWTILAKLDKQLRVEQERVGRK
ncbi:MAG: MarR family transcriptional regulator [Burkholderiaceae bacterium]|jgi:DNA-binding MarR family transcriptional regulator